MEILILFWVVCVCGGVVGLGCEQSVMIGSGNVRAGSCVFRGGSAEGVEMNRLFFFFLFDPGVDRTCCVLATLGFF